MDVKEWIAGKREELVEDVKTLVRVRSVSNPGKDDFPYGEGCSKVLDLVLCMAKSYGLFTENCEKYCGTAWLDGEKETEIGIFSHLDVVPEGENWIKTKPYEPVEIDGWIYGRGSADNKGACIAALYALRFLKEKNVTLKHKVRQFYGCDEERGMEDIKYYLKHHDPPIFSLVPDAAFPVCYGEKGRYQLECQTEFSHKVLQILGGESDNSVPGYAKIILKGKFDISLLKEHIRVTANQENTCIEAEGLATHAAKPEGGKSAIYRLAEYLLEIDCLEKEDRKKIKFLAQLSGDFLGEQFGIACNDRDSGYLTMVGTQMSYQDGVAKLILDIRYPASENGIWILEKLKEQLKISDWKLTNVRHNPSFCRDREDKVIQRLTQISNQIQGLDLQPFCMSGGTYARKLPCAVGYGPGVIGQRKPCIEGHGFGHQPDECVNISQLMIAVEIYVMALLELDKMLE